MVDAAPSSAILVVLGCNVTPDGAPGPAAARRTERAATGYRELRAAHVLVCGGRRWGEVAEADALSAALVSLGVPRAAIVRELCSLSTLENAWYARRLLDQARLSGDLHLVTCDWHMPRALECFARVGLRAHALPAPTPRVGRFTDVTRRALERGRRFLGNQLGEPRVPP